VGHFPKPTFSDPVPYWAKPKHRDGQIIKSGLPNGRKGKFLPSVVGVVYDLLRYECHLGNVGLSGSQREFAWHLHSGQQLTTIGANFVAIQGAEAHD